jgi:hypothetical protein
MGATTPTVRSAKWMERTPQDGANQVASFFVEVNHSNWENLLPRSAVERRFEHMTRRDKQPNG